MSKEYIEREAVIKYLTKCADGYSYIETPTELAIARIKAIPAADVVEVVRCKDCQHYKTGEHHPDGHGWCREHGFGHDTKDNYYCADGERKGGDGDA